MFVFRNKNTGKFVTNQQKQYNYKTVYEVSWTDDINKANSWKTIAGIRDIAFVFSAEILDEIEIVECEITISPNGKTFSASPDSFTETLNAFKNAADEAGILDDLEITKNRAGSIIVKWKDKNRRNEKSNGKIKQIRATWKYIFHDNKKYDTLDPTKAVEVIQKFW